MAQEKELAQQLVYEEQERRHQQLIKLAKEQEDRIREEGERELRIQQQSERMSQLEEELLQALAHLHQLGASQPDKAQFSEASHRALAVQVWSFIL